MNHPRDNLWRLYIPDLLTGFSDLHDVKSDYMFQIKPNTEIGAAAHAWNLLCATVYKILE